MNPEIYVLLSTYNGDKWLGDLITSLESQYGVVLKLVTRDDCSSNPPKIISKKIEITFCDHIKPNVGPAESYIHLLSHVPEGKFAAFCDQDDIWRPDRLLEGYLSIKEEDGPAISSSQVKIMDSKKVWPRRRAKLSFAKSLYENLMIGCTITMNPEAVMMMKKVLPPRGILHDEWAYTLISFLGKVVFIPKVLVDYRIHEQNDSGINALFLLSFKTQFRRIRKWRNQYKYKVTKAKYLFDLNLNTEAEQKEILLNYIESNTSKWKLLVHMIRLRVKRSSYLEAIVYGLMAMFLSKENTQN